MGKKIRVIFPGRHAYKPAGAVHEIDAARAKLLLALGKVSLAPPDEPAAPSKAASPPPHKASTKRTPDDDTP